MSVLSVPLTPRLEKAIENIIQMGVASNKADAARKAIFQLEEEAAIAEVLKAQQEVKEGKVLYGNLRDLIA
jgi:Arc/MetJ-type ribon-helix-helix transcriptional regulator